MYDEAQPSTEQHPPPAREAHPQNEGGESGQNGQEGTKKDDAQVSNPGVPPAPAPPAPLVPPSPAEQKPVLTKEEKAIADAEEAYKKAGDKLAEARKKKQDVERLAMYSAGQKAIHAVLLRADRENRQSTLSAFLDVAEGNEKQAVLDYLGALNSATPPQNPPEKKAEDKPKTE